MTRVLFVCIQNAGRSQMAEAFARDAGMDARSAGSAPAQHVHTHVADAMEEVGIDIRDRIPRLLTIDDARWADVIVTMGCGDACPVFPGTRYVEWTLADPHKLDIDSVRTIRDDIAHRVTTMRQVEEDLSLNQST